jgi:predicted dehydrogenase
MFIERLNGKRRLGKGVTRRGLMKGAGAAALSFTIMKPSSVRGTEANSRIEVGCIGFGGRGTLIAGMLKEHKGYQITSVADYFPEVSTEAGEKFAVAEKRRFSGLSGYRKLISSMPGCLTVAEMGRKATQTKKVFLVDFQMPTDPFIIEAVRHVHAGDIGPVAMLSSFYTDDGFSDPPKTETIESRLRHLIWVNDVDLGGGMIVNCDIHAIDAALWIVGSRPISAMGCSRVGKSDANGDTAYVYSLTYQFENELIMNHQGEHLRNTKGFSSGCFAYGPQGYLEANYQGRGSDEPVCRRHKAKPGQIL